jgi:DNA-binding response OmpR family regulator
MESVPSTLKTLPPKILVVDDDNALRSLLSLVLEEEGYTVTEARSGEDCLRSLAQLQPDLILLDAVMPDMDGFECCAQLRSLTEAQQTPVLMITFLDDQESIERAFQVGATDYITKPIHWPVLLQRLRRLITASQAISQSEFDHAQLQSLQRWYQFNQQLLAATVQISNPAVLWSEILGYLLDYLQITKCLFTYPQQNLSLLKFKDQSISSGLSTQSYPEQLPYYPHSLAFLPQLDPSLVTDGQNTDGQNRLLSDLNAQSAIAIPLFFQEQAIAYLYLLDILPQFGQKFDIAKITELSQLLILVLASRGQHP